ncbi:tellurite resistance TerB C-terminal domain-containing protein [Flavobacterium sp. Arc3]|uniref:tellurite resistance TerB C-terminal domain-containing protein n=1 Tax=Flavobacterium sp. Arc3 TaxID=3046686 RepID=UPI00352FD493
MKSKNTASFLALFLGGIGIHRFYLGQTAKGIFSLIFFWTYIPLFISIIDFIIFLTMSEEKFNLKYNPLIRNVNSNYKKEKIIPQKLVQNPFNNTKVTVTTLGFSNNSNDDSVIDISDQSYTIPPISNLKHNVDVPAWKHQYIYSYEEINRASSEQKKFYSIFKNSFLNNEYYDLEGNTNYAFILLFDLLAEYDNSKDIPKLENQLKTLGQYYPKTKSYGISFLRQKIKNENYSVSTEDTVYPQNNYYEEYWKLGTKYKEKLKLNEEEVILLNNIYNPSNVFFNVEFCSLEIIKLYIVLIAELVNNYKIEGTNLETEFSTVAKLLTNRHLNYSVGTELYHHYLGLAIKEIHSNIFKHCENAVREFYSHKRKLDTRFYYGTTNSETIFDTKIISKVTELLPLLISKVALPDEATEIELYSQNTNRWKIKFEELIANYNENSNEFIDSIHSLVLLNEKNPSIENIFFEASKFISKYDKESALTFYVSYLYCDLESATFNNKQLTKTIQKKLFNTNEQLHTFEKIISELIKDKDIDKALEGVSNLYKVKRKKIKLNTSSIKEVQQQHSETVELLNEYLKDEFEDENIIVKSQEISNEEIQLEITKKNEKVHQYAFVSEISFTTIHAAALQLFAKSNFSIPQEEFEVFAKSKGVFKNSLIESINDTCYEFLDDVLIEEEDDYYTININYFQKISTI